jgi:16S rRNA G966 N2-methylase RsmD
MRLHNEENPCLSLLWHQQIDTQWDQHPNFVKWDFNQSNSIPERLYHTFDLVVIDPPFITSGVWNKYAEAATLLLAPGGENSNNPQNYSEIFTYLLCINIIV